VVTGAIVRLIESQSAGAKEEEVMQATVRVIKRKDIGQPIASPAPAVVNPAPPTQRDLALTVKSWIAELQQRKRSETRGFGGMPAIANAGAGQR
jgi:hypothetical protein